VSCRELERLLGAGATEAQVAAHRSGCLECESLGKDIEQTAAIVRDLQAPVWSPALRQRLLDIPRTTVSCEGAGMLLASSLEGEISPQDDTRLRGHLSRCAACTEAAGALFAVRDLVAPPAPPWLGTRLAAARPPRKERMWSRLLSGRAVVVYAYAAALIVMLLGLNPAAVAGKAGFARLSESTRTVVVEAQSSIGDRLGRLQEKTFRTLAIWKGYVTGYGRAAVSNAISIVWKPERKKTPQRPRQGKESDASGDLDGSWLARAPVREPFAFGFRV
jgi:hypothetical protein